MMLNHSSDSETSDLTNPYPVTDDPATLGLHSLLAREIENLGAMPFDKWMQYCLYHPEFGYYTRGSENVGKAGDFFTSVSVGSCFGMILAERIAKYVYQNGKCDIVEIGANTGQLARDILDHLQQSHPTVYQNIHYIICEPLTQMQSAQSDTLRKHKAKLQHFITLAKLKPKSETGIFLSNELFDAFPIKLVVRNNDKWLERCVTLTKSEFDWIDQEITSPALRDFTEKLPDLPIGYLTEFRPGIDSFTQLQAQHYPQALSISIDYGYPRSVYYQASRPTGTLRCFHRHQADEAPLKLPGQKDITAHVDFTQLARSYSTAGFSPQYFDSQTRYLIKYAAPLLEKIEKDVMQDSAKWIRQFQTLTHPSMMGQQFNVLECETNSVPSMDALDRLEV